MTSILTNEIAWKHVTERVGFKIKTWGYSVAAEASRCVYGDPQRIAPRDGFLKFAPEICECFTSKIRLFHGGSNSVLGLSGNLFNGFWGTVRGQWTKRGCVDPFTQPCEEVRGTSSKRGAHNQIDAEMVDHWRWRRFHCGLEASTPSGVKASAQMLYHNVGSTLSQYLDSIIYLLSIVALTPCYWRWHHKKSSINTTLSGTTVVSAPPHIDATALTPKAPNYV